jgi:hypothetical protein
MMFASSAGTSLRFSAFSAQGFWDIASSIAVNIDPKLSSRPSCCPSHLVPATEGVHALAFLPSNGRLGLALVLLCRQPEARK